MTVSFGALQFAFNFLPLQEQAAHLNLSEWLKQVFRGAYKTLAD